LPQKVVCVELVPEVPDDVATPEVPPDPPPTHMPALHVCFAGQSKFSSHAPSFVEHARTRSTTPTIAVTLTSTLAITEVLRSTTPHRDEKSVDPSHSISGT
jgi:hypothetical protein